MQRAPLWSAVHLWPPCCPTPQDLTTTAAHPQYCLVTLPFNMRASFARRLAQLWQQLTTPEQR